MKKFCIIFLLSIIISLTTLGFSGAIGLKTGNGEGRYETSLLTDQYLRIHIRADSNEAQAQAVKYYVRDALVEFLTPLVADYQEKEAAVKGIASKLKEVEEIASAVLRAKGFSYGATAEITKESFPTRVYGEYTLPAGEYTALIIRLGRGEGDNWWCVVYPPLCFAAPSNEVVYKSKLKEIIDGLWKKMTE